MQKRMWRLSQEKEKANWISNSFYLMNIGTINTSKSGTYPSKLKQWELSWKPNTNQGNSSSKQSILIEIMPKTSWGSDRINMRLLFDRNRGLNKNNKGKSMKEEKKEDIWMERKCWLNRKNKNLRENREEKIQMGS